MIRLETGEDKSPARLRSAFEDDWRSGLFELGASNRDVNEGLSVLFWRGMAARFVATLCHRSELTHPSEIEPPGEAEVAELILSAPPLPGGEYLNPTTFLSIWSALAVWCAEAVHAAGGLAAFLEERAPRWHQVGRVYLHLAENKNDEVRPFAFMATYVSGLAASGQPKHVPLRNALSQYAGEGNRAALIKLLSPLSAAAKRVDWIGRMVDSEEIYRPLAWTADNAYRMLLSVPTLEECGLAVRLPNWWQKRARPQVSVRIGSNKPAGVGLDALVDFNVGVALGEESLTDEEITSLLKSGEGLVLLRGKWVEVNGEKLKEAITHWENLKKHGARDGVTFIEGMRMLAGASPDLKHEDEEAARREWVHLEAGEALRAMLGGLREKTEGEDAPIEGLHATLRPYQKHGVAWLHFLTGLRMGACLADDMGLGKTIQVLALLLRTRTNGERQPSLLIVPASLLGNWRAEAERFAPSLRTVFLHPSEMERDALKQIGAAPTKKLAGADLAVTSYSMVKRMEWLADVPWRLVILDEAQAIKNPGTRQTKSVKKLQAEARIALTGTPVENRLGDLWSLFDFINPGLLGTPRVFQTFVNSMKAREKEQFAPLRKLISPYILRRMKTDRSIIADLPDKTETTRYCNLTKQQVRLYQQVVDGLQTALKESEGIQRRGLVLQSLMRLKQVCNHPSQLTGDGIYDGKESGKFLRLAEIAEELAERQERVLVFTQFREMTDPIAEFLARQFGRPGLVLHGQTAVGKRRQLVEQFQQPNGPPFMVLSIKAGGTGLTLTAASHVIHFDRWWNPAVEDQATDRAFRIGQKRNVLVHKFVTSGSVEEHIDRMILDKRQLAADVLGSGAEIDVTSLRDDELMNLVRLDVRRAAMETDSP